MTKEEVLKFYFGYDQLKKEQEVVIDSILDCKDTIAIMPTGYGKSITFQVPAIMLEGLCIVVTPLIALMVDQVKNLKKNYPFTDYICSIQTIDEQNNVYLKIQQGKIKILYIAGERLQSDLFKKYILSMDVSLIVFDEAHTLLWSESFRYQLANVNDFISMLKQKPTILALTATGTSLCIEKIKGILHLSNPNIFKINCDRNNIFYKVIKTNNKDKELLKIINERKNKKGIIYCLTIKQCIYVNKFLKQNNIKSSIYYGSLENDEKNINQKEFTEGVSNIMICTNAFGMGIDIPDIRYIIEYSIPQSIEDFSQQSGRASRDGKYAEAIILFNVKDIEINNYFIENISNDSYSDKKIKSLKKEYNNKLDQMINFCLTKKCLHKTISNYFQIEHSGKCNMCSNCKKNSP